MHSAYQVADLDAVAAGGEFLKERGYRRAWGIGRHIQGSQIFDYWRDPDSVMVEHFADGDMFDNTVEVGWAPMTASGLAQWGPPVTRDFLGAKPSPHLIRDVCQRPARRRERVRRPPRSSACSRWPRHEHQPRPLRRRRRPRLGCRARRRSVVPLPAEYLDHRRRAARRREVARTLIADPDAAGLPLAGLQLLHPVPDARIFCQGANYRSHMIESGMDPDRAFNMLFTKSTASLTGPDDDIVRPAHVRLLDYEVELGIVIGKADHRPGDGHRGEPRRVRRRVRRGRRRQRARRPAAPGPVVQGQELPHVLPGRARTCASPSRTRSPGGGSCG